MITADMTKSFYKRYIEENAVSRMRIEILRFLWFREGHFINPMKRNEIFNNYVEEEISNFFDKKIINLPQIEFCITTKCTLKCKDCCAFIPQLDSTKRLDMTMSEFKQTLDNICKSVNLIRNLVILGGEPLINQELPQMLDYAAEKENISLIQLITNGTILPSEPLLKVLNKHNKKICVYISNYADNPELVPILKQEEIKKLLNENNVRVQKPEDWPWVKEYGFSKNKFSQDITRDKILECSRVKCNSILNGKMDICSKASAARELNLFKINDSIDLINSKNLKEDFINFYNKEYMDACAYCILSNEKVPPAIQAESRKADYA